MVFLFHNVVPKVPHLADLLPLFCIRSKSIVTILAKRRSIIDVIASALRLGNDVVNIDTNLAASGNIGTPPFFLLVVSELRRMAFLSGPAAIVTFYFPRLRSSAGNPHCTAPCPL
jgi:hypothetical protein